MLKSWLESHFYDGEDDEGLERVKKFALGEMAESPSMELPLKQLIRLVERRVSVVGGFASFAAWLLTPHAHLSFAHSLLSRHDASRVHSKAMANRWCARW